MPTYAVLGGTGKIGRELIKQLAQAPDTVLHVYARSEAKLLQMHPVLADSTSPHKIFTGALNDTELIASCISGADIVFGVVGTNSNSPDCHIAQDLAKVIIDAFSKLKTNATNFKPPTVLFVTSAGMTSDKRVHANFPAPLHWMLQFVGKHVYEDFRRAVKLFKQTENHWIPVVFVCAPGIEPGPSQGKVYAGVNIPKNAPIYITYPDLATGMIQAATEADQFIDQDIGVHGAKQPPVSYSNMMFVFVTNLMGVFAPPVWRFGNHRGWWGDK